jgi:hypothetical protein
VKPLTLPGAVVPHWAALPEDTWAAYEDFPTFLVIVWDHLGLPKPTRRQLRIARRLQEAREAFETDSSAGATEIIRAFRGIGKSYVCAAFVAWCLMRNPRDEKCLVVSASANKSKEFVDQLKGLLKTLPLLRSICPREKEERNQADRFDVVGASLSQSHSVKAVGITGQVTGSRATLIVGDDLEIEGNSKTEDARLRIVNVAREFDAIAKTEMGIGDIILLGTPQTEESVYNRLVKELGYSCLTIPARYPVPEKLAGYVLRTDTGQEVNILDPELIAEAAAGTLRPGDPTDPERFDNLELLKKESKGRSYFALQYQLDTTLSDAERYPLRQQDLIVLDTSPLKAPMSVAWGIDTSNRKNVIPDIPNLGFSGDHLLRPLFIDDEWRAYEGKMIFVDPSGRGKDETAWAVTGCLNGVLYLMRIGAVSGDPTRAMTEIAQDCRRFQIPMVQVEPNFGQGMWVAAFQPILYQVWAKGGATVEESEWAKGQKETRIIDTLEPVLTQHRLVVSESFLRSDVTTEDRNYSFLYQLTHITRDRGALKHDDRLDAVAGAVAYWQRAMSMDTNRAAQAMRDAEMDERIEDMEESLRGPLRRGLLTDGVRMPTWSSRNGASADWDDAWGVYHGDRNGNILGENW